MLNKECLKCDEGTYIEKSIWCDWGGEPLNCNNCDHEMPRYPSSKQFMETLNYETRINMETETRN